MLLNISSRCCGRPPFPLGSGSQSEHPVLAWMDHPSPSGQGSFLCLCGKSKAPLCCKSPLNPCRPRGQSGAPSPPQTLQVLWVEPDSGSSAAADRLARLPFWVCLKKGAVWPTDAPPGHRLCRGTQGTHTSSCVFPPNSQARLRPSPSSASRGLLGFFPKKHWGNRGTNGNRNAATLRAIPERFQCPVAACAGRLTRSQGDPGAFCSPSMSWVAGTLPLQAQPGNVPPHSPSEG